MSLSMTEWRQLHVIGKAVRRSDARLASLLTIFARLAADEPMPGHERLGVRRHRVWVALLPAIAAVIGVIMWTAAAAWTLARAGYQLAGRPIRGMRMRRSMELAGAPPRRTANGRS